ncbi:hypothetical protein AK830_g2722 [Neonectria ditissima]|uniref:C2H2-type domain-containing protein n=1 Tax=Neonectria ditissima TaxID=78410 RepID=A0A0P7B201_9HYPO|nr:hypothetical protein AK830_g2722 [Neonectria ditissima]
MATHVAPPPSGLRGQSVASVAMSSASASASPSVSESTLPSGAPPSRPASSGSRPSVPPAAAPPTTASVTSGVSPPVASSPHPQPHGSHISPPLPQNSFTQGPSQYVPQNGHHPQPPHATHLQQTQGPPHPGYFYQGPPHSAVQQHPPQQYPGQHATHQPQYPAAPPSNHQQQPAPPVKGDVSAPNPAMQSPTAAHGVQSSPSYQALTDMIEKASPDTVRQAVRDRWEKALLGSQYHVAFLFNATIHQASAETLKRAVKDFGANMIKVSKEHVVEHLSAEDLDEVADSLLNKVSSGFLDKALARRFETIPARQLVNALARAERLGYDIQDIVEDKHGGEHVIPSLHSLVVPSVPSQPKLAPATAMQETPVPVPILPRGPQPQPNTGPSSARLPSSPAPAGVVYCQCGWPCSSVKALQYHEKKTSCYKAEDSDTVGKELCPHCGCRFSSNGGLHYHQRVNVCGAYTEKQTKKITALVDAVRKQRREKRDGVQPPPPSWQQHQSTPAQSTPQQAAVQTPWTSSPGSDPYAILTPDQRRLFAKDMKDAEDFYGRLMQEAMRLPEPEQSKQLMSLKNRYNTKQSNTRKKYGIRLRERRSKAQIDAERTRLFGTPHGPSLSGRDNGPANKKARTGDVGQSTATVSSSNTQVDSPRKRVPMTEMGGLSGSSATAELTDPTASLQPQSSTPRQINHMGMQINGQAQSYVQSAQGGIPGTQDDPMSIDDSSDNSSGTDSDDDDIPASLPASISAPQA